MSHRVLTLTEPASERKDLVEVSLARTNIDYITRPDRDSCRADQGGAGHI